MAIRKPIVLAAGELKELPAGDAVAAAQVGGVTAGRVVHGDASGTLASAASLTHASTGTHLTVQAQAAATKPLVVQGAASQSANLQEWQDSSGAVLAKVRALGYHTITSTEGLYTFPVLLKLENSSGGTPRLQISGSSSDLIINAYGAVGVATLDNSMGFFAGTTTNLLVIGHTGTAAGRDIGFFTNNQFGTCKLLYLTQTQRVGVNTSSPGGTFHVAASAASTIGQITQAAASQTANLQEWQDSSGIVLAAVSAAGAVTGSNLSGTNTGDQPPGGVLGDVQVNSSGAFAGAANVKVEAGNLRLVEAAPGTPAAGGLVLSSRNLAGRQVPAWTGPSGLVSPVQPFLGRNRIGYWTAQGNSTNSPHNIGIGAATATGTITSRSVATTRFFTAVRRVGYVSAATAASVSGYRLSVAQFWRGNASGLGGFTFVHRFGTSDAAAVSGARMFVGLCAATVAPTDVEPNTLTDCVGVCQLSTSNNLAVITNDSAGTATTTDLGSTFPANTLSTDAYELSLFAAPNGSTIGYRIERLNTGDVATGTLSTDLPTNATLMGIQGWRSNGATALAVSIDLLSLYIETDY